MAFRFSVDMRIMFKNITCLILLCLFVLPVSCGRKRAPVPPGTLRPERIKDLSYEITAKGVILTWSVPVRNHDGSPLSHVKEFRLYKAQVPIEGGCLECPPMYGEPITIKLDSKPEPGQKIHYEDTTLQPGFFYIYQVRTVKGLLNVSDFSNKISFAWHCPPDAPQSLSAEVSETGIKLTWLPPTRFMDGTPLNQSLKYEILRKFDDEKDWTKLHGTTSKTSWFDKIRRTYRHVEYKVVPVFTFHGTKIRGKASQPLIVRAKGFGFLRPPHIIKVERLSDGIHVSWQQLRRYDISGYNIYRKDPSQIIFKLNSYPLKSATFVDKTKLRKGQYAYYVTAVDDSYPPNESPPSRMITIQIDK